MRTEIPKILQIPSKKCMGGSYGYFINAVQLGTNKHYLNHSEYSLTFHRYTTPANVPAPIEQWLRHSSLPREGSRVRFTVVTKELSPG